MLKEVNILDSLTSISLKSMETIVNQMKNCICQIHKGGSEGTGFFAKISYKNKILSYALITNEHVLRADDIIDGKNITISFNNKNVIKHIRMNSNRAKYINKNLDVTIIEIKQEQVKSMISLN